MEEELEKRIEDSDDSHPEMSRPSSSSSSSSSSSNSTVTSKKQTTAKEKNEEQKLSPGETKRQAPVSDNIVQFDSEVKKSEDQKRSSSDKSQTTQETKHTAPSAGSVLKPMSKNTNSSNKDDTRSQKKVQIANSNRSAMKKPTSTTPKSARMSPDVEENDVEAVSSELHVVRSRMTRSAPVRPRQFYAQSSNLAFLQKECDNIERKMKKMAKTNLATRPKIAPYKPFTWNSLAPYYNTDTLRYIINMPVPVRRGYNTRATASGLVDPAVSWKMDHCLTPVTPSRPELFRQHYTKRRTQSAMPSLSYDKSILTPQYPKVSDTTYDILTENKRAPTSPRRRRNVTKA